MVEQGKDLLIGCVYGFDWYYQWIDNDVMSWNVVIGGLFDDFVGDFKVDVWVFGNVCFVIGDCYDWDIVFFDQGQDCFQFFFFVGYGID